MDARGESPLQAGDLAGLSPASLCPNHQALALDPTSARQACPARADGGRSGRQGKDAEAQAVLDASALGLAACARVCRPRRWGGAP